MRQRTISTILLWSLVLVCARFLGATGAVWLIAAISVLTLHEFFSLLEHMGFAPFNRLGLVFAAAITLAPRYFEPSITSAEILAFAVVVFSVRILGERGPQARVETLSWTLFGLVYVPFMLHYLVRIVLLDQPRPHTGLVLVLWLVAVAKFCDTGALLAGLAFGRHRMAPEISPKKTWVGAAGGLVAALVVGIGLAWGCHAHLPAGFTPLVAAAAAVPIAGVAIVSDLVESIIKRKAEIKDAGHSIPGIGGMFDLSDSLILTAPLGWALFHLL